MSATSGPRATELADRARVGEVAAGAPRPAAAIRARTRAGVIFWVYLVEAAIAYVLASPWTSAIGAAWGGHPDGDRALWWAPGHAEVADLVLRYETTLRALTGGTLVGLAGYFVLGLFPLGALLGALSDSGRYPLGRGAQRAGELFGRLALVELASLPLVGLAIGVVGVVPWLLLLGFDVGGSSPRRQAFVLAIPIVLALVLVALIRSVMDLARALVARHNMGAGRALLRAFASPRTVLSQCLLSVPRWVASLGALGFGAAFSTISWSVLAIAVVHQVLALARVGLRASVLARALRLSDVVAGEVPRGTTDG